MSRLRFKGLATIFLGFYSLSVLAQLEEYEGFKGPSETLKKPYEHKIYEQKGETKLYRITENERAINYLKGRLRELDALKKRVQALEEQLEKKGK
jgi:hypothetical protein